MINFSHPFNIANLLVWSTLLFCVQCQVDNGDQDQATITLPAAQKSVFTNHQSDTIPTGVSIPVNGRKVKREDLAPPIVSSLNTRPSQVSTVENFSLLHGERKTKISNLAPITVIGGNDYPIPESILVKGKIAPLRHTPSVRAGLPEMSDYAITDLRCLNMDHGMKSSLVIATLQDRRGHLWIATDGGGVSRYDGQSFVHFTTEEGLPDNEVNALLEDLHGHIWIGTAKGIVRYNGQYISKLTQEEGLNNARIMKMIMSPDGDLWFCSRGGLGRLRLSNPYNFETIEGSLIQYTSDHGLVQTNLREIISDREGNIWIGTQNMGAHRFSPNAGDMGGELLHLSSSNGLSDDMVRAIMEDSQGKIWIGTFHRGINIYDPAEPQGNNYLTHINTTEGLSHRSIITMKEDQSKNVWIGTGGGINKYVRPPNGPDQITYYNTDHGLTHTNVYCVYEDSAGNIWLGTHDGLCLLDPATDDDGGGSQFSHFSKKDGLLSDKVISILEDDAENMWFGTMGGLHKYDGQSLSRYNIPDGLSSRSVRAMMQDDRGDLWFGTERGGLNRYNPIINRNVQYWTDQGLTDIHITAMLQDRNGHYWFGTLEDGVNLFVPDDNGDTGDFYHYDVTNGLVNDKIRYILGDKDGNIWFGTKGGGACRFSYDDDFGGTFRHFTTNEGLSHNNVNCMMEEDNGTLWFGTWGGGVARWNPSSDQWSYIKVKDGLSSNIIWTMIQDQEDRIWLATENGLSLLVPREGETNHQSESPDEEFAFYTFAKADGLKKVVFEGNSVFLNSKNHIWWGGGFNGGLSKLDLNEFKMPTKNPDVHLQNIEINHQFIDYRNLKDISQDDMSDVVVLKSAFDSIEPFYNYPRDLNLPYDQNHLTFQFTATEWSAPHKIRFSYKMDGLEKAWSPPASTNQVDYRNLPYGRFTLRAKAIGFSQEWSEEVAYSFNIKPPWWHTWWARVIYGLVGVSLIYLYISWRIDKLKKERNSQKEFSEALIFAQEEERKRIARDLHDGVGQSLLLIKKSMDSTRSTLADNQHLITSTLAEVRSISQNLHPFKLEKFGVTAAIEDVIDNVTKSTDIFITKEIENVDNMLNDKAEINVFRTIQEAMNNIVKHSTASAAKINIQASKSAISISIQDNGTGFDFDKALSGSKSLGLKTMSERISAIGGFLTFEPVSPKGTHVKLRVPRDLTETAD